MFSVPLFKTTSYLRFLLAAQKKSNVQNKFLAALCAKVLNNTSSPPKSEDIEQHRQELLKSKAWLDVFDIGVGKTRPPKRKIKRITEKSVSNTKKSWLLFNLVQFVKPDSIIELGTSFGVSAMYLALAAPDKDVYTVEACTQTLAIAQNAFEKLKFDNINASNASFEAELPNILKNIGKVDLIYFDGNHTKEATLKYFDAALPYVHEDTVFIFDDIHQTLPMYKAWKKIKANDKVSCTVNLFQMGLVFFNNNKCLGHYSFHYPCF